MCECSVIIRRLSAKSLLVEQTDEKGPETPRQSALILRAASSGSAALVPPLSAIPGVGGVSSYTAEAGPDTWL